MIASARQKARLAKQAVRNGTYVRMLRSFAGDAPLVAGKVYRILRRSDDGGIDCVDLLVDGVPRGVHSDYWEPVPSWEEFAERFVRDAATVAASKGSK